MGKAKRVAFYLRVSTKEQTTDNQRAELERIAAHRGWNVVGVYEDHGISGAKGRDQRPALDRLCKDAKHGKVDIVAAWSIDRIGRSLQHVVNILAGWREQNVAVYLHQQDVDGTTAAGRAMLGMCIVFSEFERSIIVERVNAGLARARAQGKTLGRPRIAADVEAKIKALRAKGHGKIRIARTLKIGTGTVQRVLAA